MADKTKKKYRLFALPLNAKNIEIAAQERFSRATPTPEPGYVLIYTDGTTPAGAEENTEERVNLLSQADEQWLFDSNAALIAQELERNHSEMMERLSNNIEALQEELYRKKQELLNQQQGE